MTQEVLFGGRREDRMPSGDGFISAGKGRVPMGLSSGRVRNTSTKFDSSYFVVAAKMVRVHDKHLQLHLAFLHLGQVQFARLQVNWVQVVLLDASLPLRNTIVVIEEVYFDVWI